MIVLSKPVGTHEFLVKYTAKYHQNTRIPVSSVGYTREVCLTKMQKQVPFQVILACTCLAEYHDSKYEAA